MALESVVARCVSDPVALASVLGDPDLDACRWLVRYGWRRTARLARGRAPLHPPHRQRVEAGREVQRVRESDFVR